MVESYLILSFGTWVSLITRPRSVLCSLRYRYGVPTERAIDLRSAINKGRRIITMAKIVKVIEVLSESPKSWEAAVQNVVSEASKTLRNIRSVYIKEFTATVENDKVASYRVNAKVTFEMERGA
jgi:dodecin